MNQTRKEFLFLAVIFSAALFVSYSPQASAQPATHNGRAHLLMDFGWRFAFGHPYDPKKDFDFGSGYFSYLAKAGYGDGAAAADFDDRSWRKLDLPHDWAVEQPFDSLASYSHGFKAIGRPFPDASIGWYRKSFGIPASDRGRHITLRFDGAFRHSKVWVNGFFLGEEPSGYTGFEYDLSSYLHYGGENTVAVRVDATMEEGWFYEGAGIYRHVWLDKTAPLHVASYGTVVTTQVKDDTAGIMIGTTLVNDGNKTGQVNILQVVEDAEGNILARGEQKNISLRSLESRTFSNTLTITNPRRWSVDTPYLHKMITTLVQDDTVIDRYETSFGIRTIRFDAARGFFLNDRRIELKGTNNHQDHAGVGTAVPDALLDFRIDALKALGCNAYRCSHHPPAPELLDACDRLGMLVIDENRLMGTTSLPLDDCKRMMIRDRNHPCIIAWSIGNEEWAIEGNNTGAQIASAMQDYARTIDSTRAITAAVSGGWGTGISSVIEVMGYNYIAHGSTDEQHARFPAQPGMGTEEGSTHATRGIYVDDPAKNYIAAYDNPPQKGFYSIEEGWKHYAARPYLAGMFIWTGFDYRGEPTPFGWPSVGSYFGMLDACGFPKDDAWYLRSWWTDRPVLHILPHWNWKGREGRPIDVWIYSNCDEVELRLNKTSLGRQKMPTNSHLEWKVNYTPGTLEAIGYKNGKKVLTDQVQTTGDPYSLVMTAWRPVITADGKDVSVITVQVTDKSGRVVPTAGNEINFSIQGAGKIIGVGNGDPTSHEPDKYMENLSRIAIGPLKEQPAGNPDNQVTFSGSFELPAGIKEASITLFYKSMGQRQSIAINGRPIAENIADVKEGYEFKLDTILCHPGKNDITIVAIPFVKKHEWDKINKDPGLIAITTPAGQWKRRLFSGSAQMIIQSTREPGDIILTASSSGLGPAIVKIRSQPTTSPDNQPTTGADKPNPLQ